MNITSLDKLLNSYDTFILDAYGVFWASSELGLFPGAQEAMQTLVKENKQVIILSNSTQLAAKEQAKYAKQGLLKDVHYHVLLTSGEITHDLLLQEDLPFPTPRKTYFLFSGNHPRFLPDSLLFEQTAYRQTENLEEADFIYVGIPHINGVDQEDPHLFEERVKKASHMHIPVLCANPDKFAHEGNPARAVVRQGSIAELFRAQQNPVHEIGKPFELVYTCALEKTSSPKERILMIGDTPETDIRGANNCSIASALITQTGIYAQRLPKKPLPPEDTPTHTIEALRLDAVYSAP